MTSLLQATVLIDGMDTEKHTNEIDQVTSQPGFRSRCSIARSLDLIGDKWTLLIVRDLLWHGKETFQALQHNEEHIPSNILSSRLKRLVVLGLVEKTPYQDRPVRYSYALTKTGRSLEPILQSLMSWGHGRLGGGYYDAETGQSDPPK